MKKRIAAITMARNDESFCRDGLNITVAKLVWKICTLYWTAPTKLPQKIPQMHTS